MVFWQPMMICFVCQYSDRVCAFTHAGVSRFEMRVWVFSLALLDDEPLVLVHDERFTWKSCVCAYASSDGTFLRSFEACGSLPGLVVTTDGCLALPSDDGLTIAGIVWRVCPSRIQPTHWSSAVRRSGPVVGDRSFSAPHFPKNFCQGVGKKKCRP
jgi:hypothetical protein